MKKNKKNLRSLIIKNDITMRDIAKKYHVHENAIYSLKACKTWKDITTKYFK